jgi:hypothetical protein
VTIYDDPNREAVGLAPIWTGAGEEPEVDPEKMTKAQLLDHAQQQGVEVDESMTKAEIRDAIG